MLLRRAAVQNVRSFLDRAELRVDGGLISILVGPNGGGKTNLLDIIVVIMRRYLYASHHIVASPTADEPDRQQIQHNDALNQLILEHHHAGKGKPQLIELDLEVTDVDISNMGVIKNSVNSIHERINHKYDNLHIAHAASWNLSTIQKGDRFTFTVNNGQLTYDNGDGRAGTFLSYLQLFELINRLRAELDEDPLKTPIIYLPTNRSNSGVSPSIQLAGFNELEVKRHVDAITSRSNNQTLNLAIGRLAQKYRLLLEKDRGTARSDFMGDPSLRQLSEVLATLGYEWSLETKNPLRNEYDLALKKHGTIFRVQAASSGEREILTYLLAIFALNVRDALIIIDEPELHLHPNWQKVLLGLFSKLSQTTGNQFLMATHSPTFITPESIHYVSRVYSREQKSNVIRLSPDDLPSDKHLLQIINSQNNERIFFADAVVLVEGVSDRVFLEAVFQHLSDSRPASKIIEFVSVGGKHFFGAYKKLLKAFDVWCAVIADLDYVEQIGDQTVKALFRADVAEIKSDVIDNVKSMDAGALVAKIEEAITSGSWDGAQDVWEYIKSRRRMVMPDLDEGERALLSGFLRDKRREHTYLLERGTIEAYLPEGYRSKDLEKVIRFLEIDDFLERLPLPGRDEIVMIITSILDAVDRV